MTILGQPLRVKSSGEISQHPVSSSRPFETGVCLHPRIGFYGLWKLGRRLDSTPLHQHVNDARRLHGEEMLGQRHRWQIRACESGTSDEDSSNKFESNASPTALKDVTDIVPLETFSRLPSSVSWDGTSVAVTVFTYLGVLHGPLGVGGLSVVASLLHQPALSPQTKAVSLVILQTLEVVGAQWLVQSTVKQHEAVPDGMFDLQFFKVWKNRGWLPTSALCLTGLLLVVGGTSNFGDCLPKDMQHGNAMLELVTASDISRTCIFTVSCLITPYLEEYIYRGFLLTSLAAYVGWPGAVVASSAVFVVAHFPLAAGGQALGLFFIGCLLGASYVYTGNLATSFVIHALYNATLLLALSTSSC